MSSPFRDNAVQALRAAGEERPTVNLVPARRWLTALSLVLILIAGVIFLAVATTKDPVRGIGYVDRGGFVTLRSSVEGIVQDGVMIPGTEVRPGDVVARVIGLDGTTHRVIAPAPGYVMQLLGPATGWVTQASDPVVVIARTDIADGSDITLLLPGFLTSGGSSDSVKDGAQVWLEPADQASIACTVVNVRPYSQPAVSVSEFMPEPFVMNYVENLDSILLAEATCPAGALDWALPGTVIPVTVEANARSPLSFIFGSGS